MKKWKWMAIVGMAGILAGCGPQKEATDAPAEQETVRAEEPETAENGGSTEKTPETENAGHAEMSLEDAAGLLGMTARQRSFLAAERKTGQRTIPFTWDVFSRRSCMGRHALCIRHAAKKGSWILFPYGPSTGSAR